VPLDSVNYVRRASDAASTLALDPRLTSSSASSRTTIQSIPQYERARHPVLLSQRDDKHTATRYRQEPSMSPSSEHICPDFKYQDDEISHLFRVSSQNPYYRIGSRSNPSHNVVFNMKVGDVGVERLYSLPIEPTRRNAELFHFCRGRDRILIRLDADIFCSPSEAFPVHVEH
jgi:hypothetical protein